MLVQLVLLGLDGSRLDESISCYEGWQEGDAAFRQKLFENLFILWLRDFYRAVTCKHRAVQNCVLHKLGASEVNIDRFI